MSNSGNELEHPMQPIYVDDRGVVRFKPNKIVEFLLFDGPTDMNRLSRMDFDPKDREQLAQLIGYSVSGYGELPYVREASLAAADAQCNRVLGLKERLVRGLRNKIKAMCAGLRAAVHAFRRAYADYEA